MSIARIAQSMRSRMPWPVGRRILLENEVSRGRGWDQTLGKLIHNAGRLETKIEPLVDALREHILCGEKISTFYEVAPDAMEASRNALLSATIPTSPFSEAYPYLLSEDELLNAPAGIFLAAVETNEDGVAAVFSSVRVVTVREPILPTDVPEAAAEIFDDYEEIVGLKTIRLHACDTVWLPHDGKHIDVRIDYPVGTLHEVAVAAQARVADAFHEIVGVRLLATPVNLFPLIDRIYKDPKEGTVVELGFGTTTSSLKHEKMRRKMLDLREEQYHKGGKAALQTPIEPFRLSIVWKRLAGNGVISNPEMSINSSARSAGAQLPCIETVVIRKCMGQADYEFVRSRIEHHLAAKPETKGEG
ncbi:hypothetical protein [Mesorhizobium sp. L103C131B0]|uniref:hypothetical protein n=1 Tax=Mesorhizobium sp. L103C131B0 TaxID=1287089 RepID=UPI001FD91650|nr:hypothetical protein [Mesorhizobium sp. L103C131B0]